MKEIEQYLGRHEFERFEVKAAFFDMDGVLYDSMPFHARAWAQTLQNYGFLFSEYDAYLNEGRTGEAVINEYFVQHYQREATPEECQAIYAEKGRRFMACGAVKPIEGVYEVLCELKRQDIDFYIVTGSAQRSLLDTLNNHFPGIFEREKMVTAFDVKQGKPHPEPYLTALRKAGAEPWQAFVVENAPLGVQSAVAANLFTVAVNTGILAPEELSTAGANVVLPSMSELFNIIPNLTRR